MTVILRLLLSLTLLGELETGGFNSFKILGYIEFCKGEGGKIDDKRLEILRDFISKDYHHQAGIIADIPNSENKITQERLNFFYHVMEKYKKQEYKPDSLTLLQEILKGTNEPRNDNIVEMLDKHFEELLNTDKSVKWGADYFKACNGKIYTVNVEKMLNDVIPALKDRGFDDVKFPPDLLKDQLGEITYHNIDEFLKLITRYKFSNKFIEGLTPVINETKIGSAYINLDLINFITNNVFYFRETPQIPYPVEMLKEVLRISKKPDGTTNWETANEIVKPIYLLFKKKGEELHKLGIDSRPENNEYSSYSDTYKYCSLLEKSIKGVNGKFSKERIEEFSKIKDCESLINTITGKPLDKMIEDKNLYKAEDLLEILRELKKTNRLTPAYLNASIKDYDSLFWTIIDAPKTEENKEAYSEMIKLLSGVDSKFKKGAEKLNFNQKDKNGISVLEKVINAENEELLDVIIKNSDELYYYPELDWGVNGIQNQAFKEKIKNLDLKFKDLEQSAQLCSVKTFDRLKPQLDSPLCDKAKVIENLFNIVKEQKGTIEPPDVYVYHLLDEYGDCLPKGLFDEMARWQIVERNRRMMK